MYPLSACAPVFRALLLGCVFVVIGCQPTVPSKANTPGLTASVKKTTEPLDEPDPEEPKKPGFEEPPPPAAKTAKEAAQQFLDLLAKQRYLAANEMLTPAYRRKMPLQKFQEFLEEYPVLINPSRAELTESPAANGRAKVEGKVTASGTSVSVQLDMKQDGNQWKIDAMQVK